MQSHSSPVILVAEGLHLAIKFALLRLCALYHSLIQPSKTLWANEDFSTVADWAGAGCWGRTLNQNWVLLNATSTIGHTALPAALARQFASIGKCLVDAPAAWSTIWSVYPTWPYFGNGLMYAFSPWSGHYTGFHRATLPPSSIHISVICGPQSTRPYGPLPTRLRRALSLLPPPLPLHRTRTISSKVSAVQFAQPGWRFLEGSGRGLLAQGGSWVAYVPASARASADGSTLPHDGNRRSVADAAEGDFSLVFEKLNGDCLRCQVHKRDIMSP